MYYDIGSFEPRPENDVFSLGWILLITTTTTTTTTTITTITTTTTNDDNNYKNNNTGSFTSWAPETSRTTSAAAGARCPARSSEASWRGIVSGRSPRLRYNNNYDSYEHCYRYYCHS